MNARRRKIITDYWIRIARPPRPRARRVETPPPSRPEPRRPQA